MKLFFVSHKHANVIANLDLENLTTREIELINNIIQFLKQQKIIDERYIDLILGNKIEVLLNEDLESYLEID